MARKFGGTGLGLTISKRLAAMLGGDVCVVESSPNVGTHFRLTIDAVPTEVPHGAVSGSDANAIVAREPAPTKAESPPSLKGCHLLLAEDGPDNQRLIAFLLRKAEAIVTVVENGEMAVEESWNAVNAATPFDVVLMDMQMPLMDGYEATALLRAKGYSGAIVALTAHAMTGDREKCLAAGCDDFATKPINRVELISTVARHWRGPEFRPGPELVATSGA
jgi:CheY-like chemotaxis protein